MKQIIFTVVSMVAIIGCVGSSKQYMISADGLTLSKSMPKQMQIAVDKISVPSYMEESRIAIDQGGGQISYRDEIWAVSPSKSLTTTLIRSLQKKFSNPNVYLFPWDVEKERGIRIKVTINRFIYGNGAVHLEATYFIKKIGSNHKKSYLFSTEVNSGSDTPSIVQAMQTAFGRLIEDIGSKL